MKLTISQEMLDKLKRLKDKIALFTAATVTVIGLAGCTNTDAITLSSDAPITSEMPSSEVPSSSEEMPSEEVSEELPSEDVVVEDAYSAEAIMKLVEELTVKYPYNNPEHIKALVIAGNLDYITAENLDTLLTVYGYSMDDLATLYDECIDDSMAAFSATISHYEGMSDFENLLDEQTYEKRVKLQDVIIDGEASKLASTYDEMLIQYSLGKADGYEQAVDFLYSVLDSNGVFKGIENFIYGYATMTLGDTEIYEQHFINPYLNYQNVNVK